MLKLTNLDDMVALRRDLHAHPVCYEEHRSAKLVADRLQQRSMETHTGIAVTGVVGVLRGGSSARAIMLFADMDALPIQEENRFEHRSQHPGKMHSCGHDGPTAMLLTAACNGRVACHGEWLMLARAEHDDRHAGQAQPHSKPIGGRGFDPVHQP